MKKRGFTLVELLAVISIIVLISLLLTPKIIETIEINRTKGYKEIEKRLKDAAQKYILDNYIDPTLSVVTISKEQLINNNYIDEIKDLKDKSICTASVELQKNNNQYIFIPYLECSNYLSIQTKYDFIYTGNVQTFTVPITGTYQIELWGAQGGASALNKGAYTYGKIRLENQEKIYIYIGEKKSIINTTSFNGGTATLGGHPGGGATDIRLLNGSWDNDLSLNSRIMVAAGSGAGSGNSTNLLGSGGSLIGNTGKTCDNTIFMGYGGTQTNFSTTTNYSLPKFGIGGGGCGGGGGYYGGSGASCVCGGGGGSSYISGHAGCIAIDSATNVENPRRIKTGCTTESNSVFCSIHYSGKVFTDSIMKAGNEEMPTHDGNSTMIGNEGNGYAKITFLEN